jgi:hypothetical protein
MLKINRTKAFAKIICSWGQSVRTDSILLPDGQPMLIARRTTILSVALSLTLIAAAQQKPSPLAAYVKEDAPLLVLDHVRLIDGTGSAPQEDMRIVIAGGKITAVQAVGAHSTYPANAKVLDMTGKTLIPGLGDSASKPEIARCSHPQQLRASLGAANDFLNQIATFSGHSRKDFHSLTR